MKIGAQLYTLHDHLKDLDSFSEGLKRVADIGYRYVQVSGTCDYEADWLNDTLNKYGLKCVLTHVKPDKIINDTELVINEHNVFNCKYIGIGGMPNLWSYTTFPDNEILCENFLKSFHTVMKSFKSNGKLLMYHNHQLEFAKLKNGQNILDYIAERTSPDELGFTLDTYWVQYGGLDPVDLIYKLSGRVPCVHFKDLAIKRQKDDQVNMAPVGYGNLNWDKIISACYDAKTEFALVEQDNCYGEDPFECLKKSFEFLKSKGLEVY